MRFTCFKKLNRIILLVVCTSSFLQVSAQVEEDTGSDTARKGFFHNIFQQVMEAVTVSKKDSMSRANLLNSKSETPFLRYEGRIIRHISTKELGFERTFKDTTQRIKYFGTRILNALHKDSHDWVIRDNLFIKENSKVNAYVLADNERYLRSLNFIQDARILVKPVRGSRDSVDILVITKDLFSLTGGIDVNGIDRVRAKVADNNLMGMGQRVQITTLIDRNRLPVFGYELLYSKNSIKNTFVNATIGYTLINTGRSNGTEEEKAFYIRLERPLFSPYSRLAGGLELSYNHSENVYKRPDSLFYNYRYNLYDVWGGYNLGVTKLLNKKEAIRDRSFLAFRYIRNHFVKTPFQLGDVFDHLYNSREAVLGEFTLFRQNFYKTNYIYGFGTTEDVPYGFNVALTGGWYKQRNLERPYAGVNFNQFITRKTGEFIQLFLRTGAFRSKGKLQDASILIGGNMFSKLYLYKGTKIREYVKFSYTKLYNRITSEPLRIDNPFGLQSFRSDSALGSQRLSLYSETVIYAKYKLFGFQLAPFVFADLSFLTPEKKPLKKSDLYSGLGGGLRTRNENLVFGTIELRMVYFPKPADRMNTFKIVFHSNLRFRYNSRYVRAPDIIQLNVEDPITF